ncbi:MAG: response regulator [Alphaproteobacteria bacterium]|nr:response regulator [Alphaproteobacteria bacterium]
MHRALVIEDQNLMLQALMVELKASLGDCFIAGAQTYALAHQILTEDQFDVVVIDPGLPGFDPTSQQDRLTVVETIIRAAPSAVHIVITGSDNQTEACACRQLGAAAYLAKTGLSPGSLRGVLDEVARAEFSLRYSAADAQSPEVQFSGLTPRESRVIALLLNRQPGETRRDVFEAMAVELNIDAASVEKYYKQARAKLLKRGRLPKGL